jgi:IS4 transposase
MGFCSPIKKSTLAEANERRNWRIWADLAAVLIRRARKIYIEEDLGLDLKTYRSDGKTHDTKVLDMLVFEPGAFYMMDRGYMDLQRLSRLHQAGAFYVSRQGQPAGQTRLLGANGSKHWGYFRSTRNARGLLLHPRLSRTHATHPVQRPHHRSDPDLSDQQHQPACPATTIAALYKNRWQVELYFKWIKQHLRIKHFLGTRENAVKTQIWCAVCTYVLFAIIRMTTQ